MSVFFRPVFRKAQWSALGHLNQGQGLPAGDQHQILAGPSDFKGHPETHPLDPLEPSGDDQFITQCRRLSVVDLSAHDDRVNLG